MVNEQQGQILRLMAEVERLRSGIWCNTAGVLADDEETGFPILQPFELQNLRERLESLLPDGYTPTPISAQ